MQSTRTGTSSRPMPQATRMVEGRAARLISFVVIPLLVIAVLLLPPINLWETLRSFSYTGISDRGGTVQDPDGTAITFPDEAVDASFRVQLASIPRLDFVAAKEGSNAYEASQNLSANSLKPLSPFYQLDVRGETPDGAILTIPIPNDSQPYERLALYTWTGEGWEYVPSYVLTADDRVEAKLGFVPSNFMIMQSLPRNPLAAVTASLQGQIAPEASGAAATVTLPGLYLRGDGAFDDELQSIPVGNYGINPILRNWRGETVRTDLINNMLLDPAQQDNQYNAIVNYLVGNSYGGVVIDYRGVDAIPSARMDFVNFITTLAERLHAPDVNKTLAVRVEAPTQVSVESWSTGGYDWRALGQIVDTLIIPAPTDPRAYQTNGEMEALMDFAVSEVSREKILVELPGQSVEHIGQYLLIKGYQESLQPLLTDLKASGNVAPGEQVDLTVDNPRLLNRLTYDESLGAYFYSYLDDQGFERTVYIESAASIAHKLKMLELYNVAGVDIAGTQNGDVDAGIWEVLRQYQSGGLTTSAGPGMAVAYTVTGPDGAVVAQDTRPLDNPSFAFMAPTGEGNLNVEAKIVEGNRAVGAPKSISLAMATATPVASPTPDFATLTSGQAVNVREGPSTAYSVIGQVRPGGSYRILGKNDAGDWWQIDLDGTPGWTIDSLTNANGNLGSVAVVTDIPEPPQQVAAAAAPAQASAPASAPAVSAPRPSGGIPFGYGVQAHMVHNDQAGLVMQKTAGMGFNWVKQQVEWKVFESSQGNPDFNSLEGIVAAANGAGINLLFSVVNAPDWAREAGFDKSVGGPPRDPQTFANFLGALAGKYCGSSVKALEVWNEQNLHYEWGNMPLNPAAYMDLLRPSYAAIKNACPSMWVVSGALTPAGNNGNFAIDDFTYLEGMFQNGLANYADAIGAHPSGYNVPASATWQDACGVIQRTGNSFNGACDSPHHSWSFRSTMEGYRNIANVYGAGNKQIWPTEFGWAAGGAFDPRYAYANDNSYEEQAAWTVEAYQMMRNWGWVAPPILWNLNFRVVANGTEKAQWGIVDAGWGALPVYHALANMPK